MAAGPAPTHRYRIGAVGLQIALLLQPVDRGINGPDRYHAAYPVLDLLSDRDAVGICLQAEDRQEYHLFEFAQKVPLR